MAVTFTDQGGKNVAGGKELEVNSFSVTGGTVYATTVRAGNGSIAGVSSSFVANAAAAARRMNVANMKNSDGSALATSAAAGKFGLSITAGTSEGLTGEAAQGNTKTDVVAFEHVINDSYAAGSNPSLVVNALYAGAGTAGTKTVAAAVYRIADNGTEAATLVTTSAQTITTSAADYTFAINGATLNPGDRIWVTITVVLQETGGSSSLTATVNSARFTGM